MIRATYFIYAWISARWRGQSRLTINLQFMMHTLAVIVASYIVLYIFWVYIIIPTFLSPLSKIPNAHFSSSFNPFWMLWKRYAEQENITIHAAHEKHGKIVRLGPNEVSINSVDDGIRIVYSGGFEKPSWYPNQFDNFR